MGQDRALGFANTQNSVRTVSIMAFGFVFWTIGGP